MDDQDFMALALAEAKQAGLRGEVPVGAIVVKGGEIIASGSNAVIELCDPTAHAEVLALRAAGQHLQNYRLPECELYVTLEPCAMCAAAMIHARMSRVVFGASDPKTGAAGGLLNVFDTTFNHQTTVQGGVMADECSTLLKDFFKTKRALSKG
ncbi:MAG: tRNA adenosine(34) deaminase TadA [Cytophagales bacterium]|nr:tRNA adenosine(34) deaminase TadA [Cytophagales bacterium]